MLVGRQAYAQAVAKNALYRSTLTHLQENDSKELTEKLLCRCENTNAFFLVVLLSETGVCRNDDDDPFCSRCNIYITVFTQTAETDSVSRRTMAMTYIGIYIYYYILGIYRYSINDYHNNVHDGYKYYTCTGTSLPYIMYINAQTQPLILNTRYQNDIIGRYSSRIRAR